MTIDTLPEFVLLFLAAVTAGAGWNLGYSLMGRLVGKL